VHKLLNALAANHEINAAIRRNVLAHRLPLVLSVHRGILYDSEAHLWDAVAESLGPEWTSQQALALGLGGESLSQSISGALGMFLLAASEARSVLADEQLAVVAKTTELIRTNTRRIPA
jgi:hypothetical protein